MFQISIYTLLSFLLLLEQGYNYCLSSTQLDGLCTACPSNHQLMHGFCLPHIPGCQNQISQHLCSQCVSGYTLENNFCKPQTVQTNTLEE